MVGTGEGDGVSRRLPIRGNTSRRLPRRDGDQGSGQERWAVRLRGMRRGMQRIGDRRREKCLIMGVDGLVGEVVHLREAVVQVLAIPLVRDTQVLDLARRPGDKFPTG